MPTAIALTIAGSDSGGGAGIQADLKAMSARGVYGASVITAVTAQNTTSVTAVHEIPADVVAAQIDAVLSDLDVKAIKLGMLFSPAIIDVVADRLAGFSGAIVLDPVMIAKSGDALLQEAAVDTLLRRLMPLATWSHQICPRPRKCWAPRRPPTMKRWSHSARPCGTLGPVLFC